MRRREFVAGLGVAGAALVATELSGCKGCERAPAEPVPSPQPKAVAATTEGPGFRWLAPDEVPTMQAALDRILPASGDYGFPGAEETHVIRYVDGQLAEPHFAGFARLVRHGLKFLDRVARKEKGAMRFHLLPPAQQDEVLRMFQTQSVPGLKYPSARFFEILWTFALEGYFGHPRHGGNAGQLAWNAIHFDPGCIKYCGD